MTTLTSFFRTDLVDDHVANDMNELIAAALRAEFANTETISATKQLTDNDCQLQFITASGADRTVELAAEGTGNHVTMIYNSGASNNVVVKDDSGATTYATLGPDEWAVFFPLNAEGWKTLGSISDLVEDTTPDRSADYARTYDASTGRSRKVLLANLSPYVLEAHFGVGLSPADATTYYMGSFPGFGLSASDANNRVYVPRAGVVRRVDIFAVCSTGTNETSTISFRLNGTTDTSLTTGFTNNNAQTIVSVTGLAITVAAGDYFNIKWVTPTWATNPTNLSINVKVWVS